MPPLDDETDTTADKEAIPAPAQAPKAGVPTSLGLVEVWDARDGLHARNKMIEVILRRDTAALDVVQRKANVRWEGASDGKADLTVTIGDKPTPVSLADARLRQACAVRINKMAGFEVLFKGFSSLSPDPGVEVGVRVMLEQERAEFTVEVMLYNGHGRILQDCLYPRPLLADKGAIRTGRVMIKNGRRCLSRLTFEQ